MGTQNELVQRLEDGYNKFSKGQKKLADFIREDYQVVITHSNGPQIGMIHTAMNEFSIYDGCKNG